MSHIVQVKTEFNDPDALRAAVDACAELAGVDVTLGGAGKVRFYFEGTLDEDNRADYVIKLPGRYDIGFKQNADGTLTVISDSEALSGHYRRGDDASRILGENLGLLRQEYTHAKMMAMCSARGQVMQRGERQKDGSFLITIQG